MKPSNVIEDQKDVASELETPPAPLSRLLGRSLVSASAERSAVVVGELVAIEDCRTPLVLYPGQPGTAAIAARSVVDLHGDHIGRRVLLMFESTGDGGPIVTGVLREDPDSGGRDRPDSFEVHTDGNRLIVSAKDQLVLRCGLASITLTKEGKVLIQGTYLSSHSSGVHRIKGGAVQIN